MQSASFGASLHSVLRYPKSYLVFSALMRLVHLCVYQCLSDDKKGSQTAQNSSNSNGVRAKIHQLPMVSRQIIYPAYFYRLPVGQAPLGLPRHTYLNLKNKPAPSAIFFLKLKSELPHKSLDSYL